MDRSDSEICQAALPLHQSTKGRKLAAHASLRALLGASGSSINIVGRSMRAAVGAILQRRFRLSNLQASSINNIPFTWGLTLCVQILALISYLPSGGDLKGVT